MTIKNSKYVKINSVNTLYLDFDKVNGYFQEINGSKYLILVLTKESKEIIKKYEELWSKIRDWIGLVTNSLDDYNEKCVKIRFNSDDELPLNKTIDIPIMIILVWTIFYENKNYYPQVFLD